jgi:hypothetical protein
MAKRTGRRSRRQTFEEELTVASVLSTPDDVASAEVVRALTEAAWRFDLELAISVAGRVVAARVPEPPRAEDGTLQ